MRNLILAFLMLLIAIPFSNAQRSESEIALREYFIDAEFFLAQEYYLDALNDYLQVYKRGYEDNANINYRIGICYLNIAGQKGKAIDHFKKALISVSGKYKESSLKEINAPIDAHLFLGNAYRINNMLVEAVDSYNDYKELLPEDETELHAYADQQIEACQKANKLMKNPVPMFLKNMGEDINSNNDDYRAVISADGNTLLFMHRLPFYDAIFYTTKTESGWATPENITPQIISDGDQFICSVSADGKSIYLTREDEYNSDIYVSNYVDNRWTPSEPLNDDINTKYWESHAAISADGKSLYFTSNRPGGVGEMDIYRSGINDAGQFGKAENMSFLNTQLNEDSPFLTADGKTMYFSSQGFTNMGGYDVFYCKLADDGSWSLPKNAGYPVNTTDNDVFYYPTDNGKAALMARIEDDSYGVLDIYHMVLEEEELVEDIIPVVEQKQAAIEEVVEPAKEVTPSIVEPEVPIQVVEAIPERPKERQTIEIEPLLFGFNKTDLSDEAKRDLDIVLKSLIQNPELSLEIVGFTDPVGSESYNIQLSTKRAEAVSTYLIANGGDPERVKAKGKGETDFIAVNKLPDGSDNPDGRMYNRRVELEFSGRDTVKVVIERIDPVPPEMKVKE